jgi:hypothetical protein
MTSTAVVQEEIERFLRDSESEVLCITGNWGVGKTYNWQTTFDRLRTKKQIGLSRYSYVSLFGINSLETFKQAIFENLEFIVPEGKATLDRLLGYGNQAFQQGKKAVGVLATVPKIGDALGKLSSPFLFSAIRNQIVCIDDLERRGDALSVKDVFGLASYLREQRKCKIVFLLNQEMLGELGSPAVKEFKDYFEKVIDTKIVFAPTAFEATAIAFRGSDTSPELISEYAIKLDVRNIRVLKKIERLVKIICEALPEASDKLKRQIIHSLVLLGWSKFDSGAHPPSLEYIRNEGLFRGASENERTPDEERWDAILLGYEFRYPDDFDVALIDFVDKGVLDKQSIIKAANEQEEKLKQGGQLQAYREAFRLLQDGFLDNKIEVCREIIKGFEENFDILTLPDVSRLLDILCQIQEPKLADHIVAFTKKRASPEFWLDEDPLSRPLHNKLKPLVEAKQLEAKPLPDFEQDLVDAGSTYNAEAVARVAGYPVEKFKELFLSRSGEKFKTVVLAALDFRKISNASPDMKTILSKAEQALREIGKISPLNAFRVQAFGVSMIPPGQS